MNELWAYLVQTPLLWLTLTLLVYQAAALLYRRSGSAWLNPVLLSIVALVILLSITGIPYETYFDGAQFIHFLLGPATVALALPLYAQLGKLKARAVPLSVALVLGSSLAILSAIATGWVLGLDETLLRTLAPKSATTPIAMGVSEGVGGVASLTAVLVILTGIIGGVAGTWLFARLRIRDDSVRGFALGLASHGIGTARAFDISEEAGAFAGLGLGLNGALTALLVPFILRLLGF